MQIYKSHIHTYILDTYINTCPIGSVSLKTWKNNLEESYEKYLLEREATVGILNQTEMAILSCQYNEA